MTNFVSNDPLNNLTNTFQRPVFINAERLPTTADIYPPGTQWQVNTQYADYGGEIYETSGGGIWFIGNTGNINQLVPNSGTNVQPDVDGKVSILGSGSIETVGSTNTLTAQLTGLTNHNVLVGAGTATITKVAPSATSGVPFVSQGSSSDPVFGTAVVAGGGTGATSFADVNSVILSGATSTSALTSIASGASGTVLTSNGAGVAPSWQANRAVAGGNIQVFTSNGTYTPTAGMTYCIIECVGGGGSGSAYTNGTGGGTTSVGSLVSATGGQPGVQLPPNSDSEGGSGGIGIGGTFNCAGNGGGTSYSSVFGGIGGSSFFGGGANSPRRNQSFNGGNYGGGGSGASTNGVGSATAGSGGGGGGYARLIADASVIGVSQSITIGIGGTGGTTGGNFTVPGGNGANGVVIITEFF